MPNEEVQYKLMRLLEAQPELSQRDLARELGVSVGKAHYCLRALIEKGFVKARNFQNSERKLGYAYALTPRGLQEKAQVTVRFLTRKTKEYESMKRELEDLKKEAGSTS